MSCRRSRSTWLQSSLVWPRTKEPRVQASASYGPHRMTSAEIRVDSAGSGGVEVVHVPLL
jgi:hypothetical protein